MLIKLRFVKSDDTFSNDEIDTLKDFKIKYQDDFNCYMYDSSKSNLGVFELYKRLTETLGYTNVVLSAVMDDPRLYEFVLDKSTRLHT